MTPSMRESLHVIFHSHCMRLIHGSKAVETETQMRFGTVTPSLRGSHRERDLSLVYG